MAKPKREPIQALPPVLRKLCAAAQEARQHAYAPYSGFRVGAAVYTSDGRMFTGANVENASYGLSVCAERSAVLAAVLAGARELRAVAISSDLKPPAAPCGMCRQTLAEFASDCEVLLCGPSAAGNDTLRLRLSTLLPNAFSPASLHAFAEQQETRKPQPKKAAAKRAEAPVKEPHLRRQRKRSAKNAR
jgi:cytidine deaminase